MSRHTVSGVIIRVGLAAVTCLGLALSADAFAQGLPGLLSKLREAEIRMAISGREEAVVEYAAQNAGSTDPAGKFLYNYTRPEREEAEIYFRENMAKAADKDKELYQLALGIIYTDWKVDDRAIKALNEAVNGNPLNFLAFYHRGLYHLRRDEYDESLEDLKKSLSIDPGFALSHLALGNMLRKKGDDDKAVIEYGEAIKLEPGLFDVHYTMGQILMAKGRLEEAMVELKKAGELRPGSVEVQIYLGSTLEKMDRTREALAAYQLALAARHGDPDILVCIGRLQEKIGDKSAEYAALDAAVKSDCKDPAIILKLGWLSLERNELDKAEKCFMDAAKQRQDDHKVYLGLARVWVKKDDYRKAIDYYRRTLLLESASKEAKDELLAIEAKFYVSQEKYGGKTPAVVYENFKAKVLKAYKILLKTNPTLRGALNVKVTIDSDGNVTDVQMDGSTANKAFDVAIYGNAFQAKFPPATKGTQYNMPIKLTPASN